MNWTHRLGPDRAGLVDRLTDDIHDAAERAFADRHLDRVASVAHLLAADQSLRRVHRNGADGVLAEVLRDLEDEPGAIVLRLERVQDRRQMARELHVHHRADHLGDFTCCLVCHCGPWEDTGGRVPTT